MTLSYLSLGFRRISRINYEDCIYDPDPDQIPRENWPQIMRDERPDDYYDRLEEWRAAIRRIVQPEPETFKPPQTQDNVKDEPMKDESQDESQAESEDESEEEPQIETPKASFDLKRIYGYRGLQAIVKLANIELSPEKPDYQGGTWHVEGQLVGSNFFDVLQG